MHDTIRWLGMSRKAFVMMLVGVVDAAVVPIVALLVGAYIPEHMALVLAITAALVVGFNIVAKAVIDGIATEDAAALQSGWHSTQRGMRVRDTLDWLPDAPGSTAKDANPCGYHKIDNPGDDLEF